MGLSEIPTTMDVSTRSIVCCSSGARNRRALALAPQAVFQLHDGAWDVRLALVIAARKTAASQTVPQRVYKFHSIISMVS
jgi:hypothetical protein